MKLTKRVVDVAAYQGSCTSGAWTRHVVWDDDLHGFGLRVYPSGRKVFVLSYRARGQKRLATIGPYGVLTVDEARQKASRLLYAVGDGADPVEDKRAYQREPTLAELAQRYLDQHGPKKKASSLLADRRLLERHILPRLGQRKARDLDRADVTRLHHEMRATPILANRALALLSKMLNLAEAWGVRADGSNPVRHIDRYPERAKERYLSPQELARLGEALRAVEQEGTEHPSALLAIRLLALTGARRNEILELTWSAVDFDRAELVLTDSKTGPKRIRFPRQRSRSCAKRPGSRATRMSVWASAREATSSASSGRGIASACSRGSLTCACTTCGTRTRRLAFPPALRCPWSAGCSGTRTRPPPSATRTCATTPSAPPQSWWAARLAPP